MIAITHFAVGLTIGLLLFVPVVSEKNTIPVFVASGVWAMLPDVGHFIGPLEWLFSGLWSNVFWFHGILDTIETQYPNIEATIALATLCSAVILVRRKV